MKKIEDHSAHSLNNHNVFLFKNLSKGKTSIILQHCLIFLNNHDLSLIITNMHIYLREGVKTLINPNNKSRDIDDLKKEEILLSSNITEIEDFGTINKDIAEVMKLVIRESI